MKTKQRTRREAFGIKRLSKDAATGNEEEGANPNEKERRDDVSIPPESAFKKSRGKDSYQNVFRLDRPNLLMLLPSRPIYKCKIAYVPLSPDRSRELVPYLFAGTHISFSIEPV